MCELCALTCSFDPSRHQNMTLSEAMRVLEVQDASDGRFTAYSMEAGDTFSGTISHQGDRDWVAVTFTAGAAYDISIDAFYSGGGTLPDSYLRIYNANGVLLQVNDDGGLVYDSDTTFIAPSSGTYYVSAGAFADISTGTYTLKIEDPFAAPPVGTLDDLANYLTDGFWYERSGGPRRFDVSSDNLITVDITNLNADGQRLARWAFDAWELVADIEFVEVNAGADINFFDNESGAYAFSDTTGAYIDSSTVNVSTNWLAQFGTSVSSYSFATYIHEIGHALGLGHQGLYNGSASISDANFANDSWQLSVMSYFRQSENPTTTASDAAVVSAMMADIVAIQNLYGAADQNSATGGNTIWGTGTNLDGYLGDLLSRRTNDAVTFTIYDAGGIDTIDLTLYSQHNYLDLNDQSFSNVAGEIGNIGIARDTEIENATLGSGNDTIHGNELANRIDGGAGSDDIFGDFGNDRIIGAAGNDRLFGQVGSDRLLGGSGSDTLAGHSGQDTLGGGLHNDSIYSGRGDDFAYGGQGNDLITGDDGDDSLWGERGSDFLLGGYGNDRVFGNANHDTLYGGRGSDTLNGGYGNDSLDGGIGLDQLFGLFGNDHLEGGSGGDLLNGGQGDDVLYGEQGHDTIVGGDGSDTLYGGQGNDMLTGGSQADVFAFNANLTMGDDTLTDFQHGIDTIEITGAVFGDLSIDTVANGQRVSWDDGSAFLVDVFDLSADDFLFV